MIGRLKYLATIGAGELSGRRVSAAIHRRVSDVPHRIGWSTTRAGRAAAERLLRFKDIHPGEQCVLIANGPSLRNTPFDLLKNETLIGLNRVHLFEEEFGLRPDYAVVSDILSQLQHIGPDLARVPIPKFVNWNGRRYVEGDDFYFFKTSFRPRFSEHFASTIYGGHSVTYAALQLAFFMGFRKVVLIGKDHSYASTGEPKAPVISDGTEQNHFSARYYQPGQMWRVPDYKGEEMAYGMARDAFARVGGSVLDATVGGKLKVFPKVDLASALAK